MNAVISLLALTAAGLVAVLIAELRPQPLAPDPAPPPPLSQPQAPQQTLDPAPATLARTLLERPLFSQTRRPPNVASAAPTPGSTLAPLPRMTAILIDGPNRSAIFATPNGRPTIVAEGGQIGPFTIQTIEPQQVTILGPEGKRIVRTSFDPTLQAPAAAQPFGLGLPQFPGIVPGLPQPAGAAR